MYTVGGGLGKVIGRKWVLRDEQDLTRDEDTQRASRHREEQSHRDENGWVAWQRDPRCRGWWQHKLGRGGEHSHPRP